MFLPPNILFYISIKGAKGVHYPQLTINSSRYTIENLSIIEKLSYLNDKKLHALRIDPKHIELYDLPNNTIWITEDDYRRIRTQD